MRRILSVGIATFSFLLAPASAQACRVRVELKPEDVSYANVVVIGKIVNYQIVRDLDFRRKMLSSPNLSDEMKKFYAGPGTTIGDYARFRVQVEKVLVGTAPSVIEVTWYNSTFGIPPEIPGGPFLIALQNPTEASPPLRGPSATILPNAEPRLLTVLQAPCAGAFILQVDSPQEQQVRRILAATR